VFSTGVRVFYIDFGNSERLKLNRVRPLPPELLSYPCQAFACSLAEVCLSVSTDSKHAVIKHAVIAYSCHASKCQEF